MILLSLSPPSPHPSLTFSLLSLHPSPSLALSPTLIPPSQSLRPSPYLSLSLLHPSLPLSLCPGPVLLSPEASCVQHGRVWLYIIQLAAACLILSSHISLTTR